MKKIILLILILSSCKSTFYVVRHAEKATEPVTNPGLTETGKLRAEKLSKILSNKKIKAIYSTQTLRTESTAKPIAIALGLTIEIYDPKNQSAFIEKLKKSKNNSLIVGHSNTLKPIVNGLFEKDTLLQNLADDEYSNLFIIKRSYFPIKRRQIFIEKFNP